MAKRTFKNFYQEELDKPSPAFQFLTDMAKLTNRSIQSVRKWVAGDTIPDLPTMLILERHFNVPFEELFPVVKTKSYGKQRT